MNLNTVEKEKLARIRHFFLGKDTSEVRKAQSWLNFPEWWLQFCVKYCLFLFSHHDEIMVTL